MAAQYDLDVNKNCNLNTWIQYLSDTDVGVDLSSYRAELKIERYKTATYPLVFASTNGVTYGYTGASSPGTGAQYGGIQLNVNYTGASLNGGILIELDKNTTNSLPVGKLFYDLKLLVGLTYSEKLLEGRLQVNPE
jgi:hypothetical protein